MFYITRVGILITLSLLTCQAWANDSITLPYRSLTIRAYEGQQVTGSCAIYKDNTYCWDDGLKVTDDYRHYHDTYWGIDENFTCCAFECSVSPFCQSDYFKKPVLITPRIRMFFDVANFFFRSGNNRIQKTPEIVMKQGIAHEAHCTLDSINNRLDCSSFVIELQ